jgi:hypothetical protein
MKLIIIEYNPSSGMQNFIFDTEDKKFFKQLKKGIKNITNDVVVIKKKLVKDTIAISNKVSEVLNNWTDENQYLVLNVD